MISPLMAAETADAVGLLPQPLIPEEIAEPADEIELVQVVRAPERPLEVLEDPKAAPLAEGVEPDADAEGVALAETAGE